MKSSPSLAERLSSLTHSFSYHNLPSSVVHEAKRRIIDSWACVLGAWGSSPAQAARSVARGISSSQGALLWGSHHKTSPEWASFVHGSLVRYLDYNDTYLSLEPCHPSDQLGAAWSVAEAQKRSGRAFLTAWVLGYEVVCRFCDAASLRIRGWDHVTYGLFSGTLLSAHLLGLTEKQTAQALSIAGVGHVALRQTRVGEVSPWKACASANAFSQGVRATYLAQAGLTGPSPFFEGRHGFIHQVSGPLKESVWKDWGKRFKILETHVKFFPAEYHAQSAIEAALKLREFLFPRELHYFEKVEVESFKAAVEIIGSEPEKWEPPSRETADHSLPYLVAVALLDGAVTLGQYQKKRWEDPDVQKLLSRIQVKHNPSFSKSYPHALPHRIRAWTPQRRVLEAFVKVPRGHAKNPMSDSEIEAKFMRLAGGVMSPQNAQVFLENLWNVDKITPLSLLTRRISQWVR